PPHGLGDASLPAPLRRTAAAAGGPGYCLSRIAAGSFLAGRPLPVSAQGRDLMPLFRGLRRRARRAPASGTTPPRRPPALEPLEARTQPSGLSFQFQIDDPGREFTPYPLLARDLNAVGQILSGVLDGRGTVQVRVRPDDTIARSDGGTVGVVPVGSVG